MYDGLVCYHGHRWNTGHNACFLRGETRPTRKFNRAVQTWYTKDNLKVGYFDIETDGLKADFSTLLSWCIKERDGKIVSDVITKEELFSGEFDKNLVDSCVTALSKFDVIVTYFGTNFDIPYIRAKAFHYKLPFPDFQTKTIIRKNGKLDIQVVPSIYHFDLYFLVKSKFCISRKSLDNICYYLGIEGKTPLQKEVWNRAKYGDPEAIKLVLEHNEGDVIILEELHKRLEGQTKWMKKSI